MLLWLLFFVSLFMFMSSFSQSSLRMNIVFNDLAKLGNVVEANVSEFSCQKTCCGNKFFLLWNKYKNIFASWTQILHPKRVFPTLVSMKTMLTSFQCCWLIKKCFLTTANRRRLHDGDRTGNSPAQKVTNRLSSLCFSWWLKHSSRPVTQGRRKGKELERSSDWNVDNTLWGKTLSLERGSWRLHEQEQ